MRQFIIALDKEQCELLEDILWEIEESRTYEGRDKKILDELKSVFTHKFIKEYFK